MRLVHRCAVASGRVGIRMTIAMRTPNEFVSDQATAARQTVLPKYNFRFVRFRSFMRSSKQTDMGHAFSLNEDTSRIGMGVIDTGV